MHWYIGWRYLPGVNRADELRRKLALYRGYLAKGVEAELASIYLREIARLKAELKQLERTADTHR